jgi:hypothetical protein
MRVAASHPRCRTAIAGIRGCLPRRRPTVVAEDRVSEWRRHEPCSATPSSEPPRGPHDDKTCVFHREGIGLPIRSPRSRRSRHEQIHPNRPARRRPADDLQEVCGVCRSSLEESPAHKPPGRGGPGVVPPRTTHDNCSILLAGASLVSWLDHASPPLGRRRATAAVCARWAGRRRTRRRRWARS